MYAFVVADPRNPSGRRPPILPLPPPPDTDDPATATSPVALHDADEPVSATVPVSSPRRRRSPTTDVTSDLPRLPEVALHEEASEVNVDPRSLAPGRTSLSVARALPMPPSHPRAIKPTAPQRSQRGSSASRALMNTPRPPPRSAAVRVETAQYSSLIGGRYQILTRIGQIGRAHV